MAFDGMIIKYLVSNYKNSLIGARVNKILQPNKFEIIFNLYNKDNYALDICIHPNYYRMCLTNYTKPNPTNALNFCMLLRKYLSGAKIKDIYSYDLDNMNYHFLAK